MHVFGMFNAPFDGPLGWRTTFDRPARGDLDGILVYYANVDRFVDSYSETNYSHIHPTAPFYQHDLNLSPEEAFLYAPRLRLTPAGQEAVRNAGHYYQSILARFLRSKYDERAALERLARILGVIPLMEGVLRALEARMIQATLFNLAEMQGTLTHSLYISKRFR
ncbi:hypothetical protein M3Y99_01921900 [Aphelenchoides fujianensis]|nr:hypothetical protein M3Y99_01921900 [Aphelenchoides fujianensis]